MSAWFSCMFLCVCTREHLHEDVDVRTSGACVVTAAVALWTERAPHHATYHGVCHGTSLDSNPLRWASLKLEAF